MPGKSPEKANAEKTNAEKTNAEKTIKVTLIRSVYGQLANIRGSVKGLGLRRIGHCVVVADTPSNRGMVNTASHMLKVEAALGSGKV